MNDPKRKSTIETEPHPGGGIRTTINVEGDGTGDYAVVVSSNGGGSHENEVYVAAGAEGDDLNNGFAAVDADELRDAIDRAVGPREEPEGVKPYRAKDRDRLLRHIEDLEATLARRNVRHERDQGIIRHLTQKLIDLETKAEEQKTAEEYLELAWKAATLPPDGKLHRGERFIVRHGNGDMGTGTSRYDDTDGPGARLLTPRPEPTAESVAEEHGLEEWEIELLRGGR